MMNHRIWHKTTARALRQVVLAMLLVISAFGQSSLLPDGKQQFLSNTGVPLASGKVFMYVPNTTTFKNTWQDAAQVTLNTNPVILDSSGRALIYGSGVYRQLVQTSAGVTIYDAVTTSTLGASDVSFFYGNATSTGTANAQIIAATTPATFALTTGYTLTFKPGFANTSATQINVASTGLRNLMKASAAGPTALTGGELVANQVVQAVYDGTQFVLNTPLPPLELVNAQTGTTYTFQNSDSSKLVTAFNAAAQAYTLPQAGAASTFLTGWFADIHNKSTAAAGVVTITPTISTIDGAATLALSPGGFARIVSDGTNYQVAYKTTCASGSCPPVTNPTTQRLLSGAAQTYTAAAGVVRQRVRMVASGGGGGATTTNAGTVGNTSSFQVNSTGTIWTCTGGAAGTAGGAGAGAVGGAGGTNGSTGNLVVRIQGNDGGAGTTGAVTPNGYGGGGGGGFGGGGGNLSTATTGHAGGANTGGGGGGGSNGTTGGGGGGGGEYVEFWVTGMTTATYTVGASAAGGIAGSQAGGASGSGIIIVEEFYQ